MRIKKKTSTIFITAAAVAAIGVSAVSFASWTGNNTARIAKAETGYAYLFGFTSAQEEGARLELGTLVPYNQDENTIKADKDGNKGTTVVSVALPEYEVTGNYNISVKYPEESTTTLDFYVYAGAKQDAVPADWTPESAGDWQQISKGARFDFTSSAATVNTSGNETVYISLMLVSDDAAQMGQSADIDIVLAVAA